MRNSSEIWCDIIDISLEEIECRALIEMQNNNYPTMCYISLDLYNILQKSMRTKIHYSPGQHQAYAQNIVSINTSAGSLIVKQLTKLRNFLLVARVEDFNAITEVGMDPMFWNDEEKQRIDEAFEVEVIEVKDET